MPARSSPAPMAALAPAAGAPGLFWAISWPLVWSLACTIVGLALALGPWPESVGLLPRAALAGSGAALIGAGHLMFFRLVASPAFPRAAWPLRVGMEVSACVVVLAGVVGVLICLALGIS